MSDSTARRSASEPHASTVIALRLDLSTARLLQAAAASEGFHRMATYLRQTVRTHVRQSDRIDPQIRDELVHRIAGQNLVGLR